MTHSDLVSIEGLTRGEEAPRPTLLEDLSFAHPPTDRRITWLTEIDGEALWADLTGKIDRRRTSALTPSA